MEWISIEDRLPETTQAVICCNANNQTKIIDKLKVLLLKYQGMPMYQNMYLGNSGGKLQVKNGGGVGVVKNCYYDPKLASYIYWLDANGIMVTVPECNLEPVTQK